MTVPKKIADLVKNSGNTFHSRVARWFSDNGWHVVVSPYYMDQTQSKAREIDLIAEKLWPVTDAFGRPEHSIAVRLFVECKFVATDAVFWFAEKDHASALELVCANGVFRPSNSYTEKHHYLSQRPRVAKLFATDNSRLAENEPFYKALNQALNAMTSMRGHSITVPSARKGQTPRAIFEYPVIACSSFDRLFAVDFDADSQPTPIRDNFQLEVRYAYVDRQQRPQNEYFLLDFIAFEKLAEFGDAIDKGTKAGAFLIGE
jgi:hypothetical protein